MSCSFQCVGVYAFHHSDLKPLRIPLHSKRSKRCPACTHILIKPEQKAQSVRYKIKLVASNYLPDITINLPHLARRAQSKAAGDDPGASGLLAGKSYPFHLALLNPLYDPIQVRLSVQRVHVATGGDAAKRPPFAVSLPTSNFPIAAFAEAWEYDDDDDEEMFLDDDASELGARLGISGTKSKNKTIGVLEKRANVTVVGGEVVIGREAQGNVKVPLLLLLMHVGLRWIDSSICWSPIRIELTTPLLKGQMGHRPSHPTKPPRPRPLRSILLLTLVRSRRKRSQSSIQTCNCSDDL